MFTTVISCCRPTIDEDSTISLVAIGRGGTADLSLPMQLKLHDAVSYVDIGVKYSDNMKDADVPQAKGSSFEDIDAAVNTIKAPKATDKEKRHAGKVFHEMDGNQFYEKFMENSEECKKNIHDYVTFYLQTHKIVEISKPKKEFKVPDSIEDFNILDFV